MKGGRPKRNKNNSGVNNKCFVKKKKEKRKHKPAIKCFEKKVVDRETPIIQQKFNYSRKLKGKS